MIGAVGLRRVGWWVLVFVLSGVVAGCGSDGEALSPLPSTSTSVNIETAEQAVLEVDEFGFVDTSLITDTFYPEITEGDIEVVEGDAGTSYRYVFPTRELSDGVSVDLEARWDPVDGGLQSSLNWILDGGETSPSNFVFVASIPKSFAETADDIVFEPQPTEIIDPDPILRWEIDVNQAPSISAVSTHVVRIGDVGAFLDYAFPVLNEIRIHADITACDRWSRNAPRLATCYLAVVAKNPRMFGDKPCDVFGGSVQGGHPAVVLACRSVVELATNGATDGCDRGAYANEEETCRDLLWGLFSGACIAESGLEQLICAYDAAVTAGDEQRCASLERLGNLPMANDCRASITKDHSWCAMTEDPKLRASCCENFSGTDTYDTCLASIAEATTEQETTTTTDEETTTTAGEEVTTTEAAGEGRPPAIPAGTYIGSFNEAHLVAVNGDDFLVRKTNTITVTIDDEGLISGGFTLRQEGSVGGCPGWIDDYSAVIDTGQQMGSTLPQVVSTAVHYSGQDSLGNDLECLDSPRAFSEQGTMRIELTRMSDGVLVGALDDFVYVPFKLQLTP